MSEATLYREERGAKSNVCSRVFWDQGSREGTTKVEGRWCGGPLSGAVRRCSVRRLEEGTNEGREIEIGERETKRNKEKPRKIENPAGLVKN